MDRCRAALSSYTPQCLDLADGQMSAAVLVAIYPEGDDYHVLLTKRSELVEYHKGQISFPGGGYEPHDADLMATALRETEEEIGVRREDIEIIGQLDDVVTVSNFRVRPYVGVIKRTPYDFVFDPIEVAAILPVPFAHLTDEACIREETVRFDGVRMPMRSYVWEEHVVWGTTAQILRSFLDLLNLDGSIDDLIVRSASTP